MAPRRRRRRTINIDQMVKRAFERNGINTLLLDLKEDQGKVLEKVERVELNTARLETNVGHVMHEQDDARDSRSEIQRSVTELKVTCEGLSTIVGRIAPLVDQAEARFQQSIGEGKFWTTTKEFFAKWWGWLLGGGAAAGGTAWLTGALDWIRVKLMGGP